MQPILVVVLTVKSRREVTANLATEEQSLYNNLINHKNITKYTQ